ncbi:MAG: PEP/pyruvate-binding domain-containing protein [Anaerolineales bacterium]|jgi:hypothetical protein
MTLDPTGFPKVLTLYLKLSQYPILGDQIRKRMRQELFERGVVSEEAFDAEVLEKAVQSQTREGLRDPFGEEPADVWARRLSITRDHLTDFYFAYNLPHDLFEDLVRQVLAERVSPQDIVLTFHPELAPWEILFAQGQAYERLPDDEKARIDHHLEEIKVVLIKAMISDHLEYLGIAKEWFDIDDLESVRARRFGRGKIGGKAAGLALAETILRKSADKELLAHLLVPRSWFLGADVFYQFTQYNDLLRYANQKYRSEEEIRGSYPEILQAYGQGRFPEDVVDGLRSILEQVGEKPLIVRSSSLLEDSFGTSFAGKYQSRFCPNQASAKENLRHLIAAICNVYASVYSPEVLLYRRRMGLLDYDERMAILIQEVQGSQSGRYFLPHGAGVAFSRNQFRWSPRIARQAGFVRLVYGLGTRAVENVDGDYPRLVALSHPELRPEVDPKNISAYSQGRVDLIDLEANEFRTLPVSEVLGPSTQHLPLLAQRYQDGHLQSFLARPGDIDPRQLVITFDGLLGQTPFADFMRRMLQVLETAYRVPVDTEFTVTLERGEDGRTRPVIHILQCRPLSRLEMEATTLPTDIPENRRIFVTKRLVPDGRVSGIRYVVYVSPEGYYALGEPGRQQEVARLLRLVNKHLQGEVFILIGPGRWGSVDPDLGIPVTYADIYNAAAIVELTTERFAAEPSYGTHFFQDLVETRIFPLALSLEDPGAEFRQDYLEGAENVLARLLPEESDWSEVVRVIDIPATSAGAHLELVMDGDSGAAMAYIS